MIFNQRKKPVTRKECPIARALRETRHRNALRLKLGRALRCTQTVPQQYLVCMLREELRAEEERAREQLSDARRYWRKLNQAQKERWW